MTKSSDYDILRYLTEKEAKEVYGERWWPRVSATEMNERRRRKLMGEEDEEKALKELQEAMNEGDKNEERKGMKEGEKKGRLWGCFGWKGK